jgi:hypothetical protein
MRNKKRLNRANGAAQSILLGGPLSPLALVNTWRRGSKNRHIETMNALQSPEPTGKVEVPNKPSRKEYKAHKGEYWTGTRWARTS